jgi:rhamnogalacturonyl hydrolase YesR
MFDLSWRWCAVFLLAGSLTRVGTAQQPVAGDAPADPGPLAKDLSPELHSKAIRPILRKVADWQLARVTAQPMARSWDWGTLDLGLASAARTLGDARLSAYVASVGQHYNWHIDHTAAPAEDYALAQALIDVVNGNPKTTSAIRLRLDGDLQDPFDPDHPLWNRTDALFFEAPAAAELSNITADPTYDEFVNREWHRTEKLLYDRQLHLFSTSQATLGQHEKNGKPLFEARANGMAMAGLIRVLSALPSDDPLRPIYVDRLREMAQAVAAAQQPDGLWRPGLLDPASYTQPAVAGSSLIVYALAWGITHHHLDARLYLPVVERAWTGLIGHIYQDGRLGSIEPIGAPSTPYTASSSWNYGVGAFLLAAGEVDALSGHKHW